MRLQQFNRRHCRFASGHQVLNKNGEQFVGATWVPEEIKVLGLRVTEILMNQFNQLNPPPSTPRKALNDKIVQLEVSDLALSITLFFSDNEVSISQSFTGPADAYISTDVASLFALARNRGKTPSNVRLEIQGDMECSQQLKKMLDEYEIDWEEILAKLTNDVFAHSVGQGLRRFRQWVKTNFNHSSQNLAEYLIEERRTVIHPIEIKQFVSGVDQLRHQVERVAARLNRIKNAIQKDNEA